MTSFAIGLILFIALAHSYLGERYLLIRLFRQPLPKLFGSDDFTRKTLRFAWHITGVAWLGFAALLSRVNTSGVSRSELLTIIGLTFGITGAIALVASRGRHLSWLVFGGISLACLAAA